MRDFGIDALTEVTVSPEDDAEVVLAPSAADAAHPAFSNLFVKTEILRSRKAIPEGSALKSSSEKAPWMWDPIALTLVGDLSGTEGPVLDPAVAIRCRIALNPGETVAIRFVTGVAESRGGGYGAGREVRLGTGRGPYL